MATVYLAEDLKQQRKVAVKVLRPDLAASLVPSGSCGRSKSPPGSSTLTSSRSTIRARRTASSTTSCPTWRASPCASGWPSRGNFPVPDAVRILTELVEELAYAHGQGIVHRDLKPENIMPSGRDPLVMDFGTPIEPP